MPVNPLRRGKDKRVLNYYAPRSIDGTSKHSKFINHLVDKSTRTRTNILVGGYGSGKTYTAAFTILYHLLENPEYRGKSALVVGLTDKHNYKVLLPIFKNILTHETKNGRENGFIEGTHYKVKQKPLEISLPYGGQIYFASLEAGQNLSGFSVTLAMADEIDKVDLLQWKQVGQRIGRDVVEAVPGFVIGTANPTNPSHWLYEHYFAYLEEHGVPPEGTYLEKFSIYDNHYTKHNWKGQEQDFAYSNLAREQFLMGEFVSMEGCVFSQFNREQHVVKRADLRVPLTAFCYQGVDFGGGSKTADPTAAVWVAALPDGRYYVYNEYYNNLDTIKQHAKALLAPNFPGEVIMGRYSDHYTESLRTYENEGVKLTKAEKGAGSVDQGVRLLSQLLVSNRLVISQTCVNLIREFETYIINSRTGKPIDKNNHAIDALRYIITELEGKTGFASFTADDFKFEVPTGLIQITANPNIEPEPQATDDENNPQPPQPTKVFIGYDPWGKPEYALM